MALGPIEAIERIYKINREAAKVIAGGFLLVFLAVWLVPLFSDQNTSFWAVLSVLIGCILVAMLLVALPQLVRQIAGTILMVMILVWAGAILAQTLNQNRFPFATVKCLTTFNHAAACGTVSPAAAGASTPVVAVEEPGSGEARASAVAVTGHPVFVQFAGYDRDVVEIIAGKLVQDGWNVQGADRGGERNGSAAGLNEVRFFHPADAPAAERLAGDLAKAAGRDIGVKDLSGTRYATKEAGQQLEIWMSV